MESGGGRGSFEDRKELHIFVLMGMIYWIYWEGGKPMLETFPQQRRGNVTGC